MIHTLEASSILKSFSNRTILSDIYLKCSTGDIVGLLGRNGTGKSTLMKIVFGILPAPDKFLLINRVRNDQPFTTLGQIGYLPQHSFLLKNITADKAASFYVDKDLQNAFFEDAVISKIRHSKISNLSGGELRYLEIKLLLNSDNKFLLLDEPFNGIAPLIVEQVKDMIRKHSATKGIILTDHDYNNVINVANRLLLLYDGGLKAINTEKDLQTWGYLNEV